MQIGKKKKQFYSVILSIAVLCLPLFAYAFTVNHDFPRTTAWQLNTGKTPARELARYDSVILNMSAARTHPQLFTEIRRLNPDVIILAYTSAVEFPGGRLNEVEPSGKGIWHDLGKGIKEEWKLKTIHGQQVSFWPGHWSMNPSGKASTGQTYANYVGNFLVDNVLNTGKFDGLFFDTTWDGISWHDENIDIDNDRQKDSKQEPAMKELYC